ncbi:MAG: maleylpyruvate isomerase family mycothiol-dependent enzyme [Anaerolineae bacterium]|nr:maleylpyruvate isomerase family mycothiol-dependent enzyme [Anaerolineae bacterium]
MKTPPVPFSTAALFPQMRAELLRVLRSLPDEAWALPTACPGWSVRDVAGHILADDLAYLSRHRDHDGLTLMPKDWDDLVQQINAHNDLWVRAAKRISRSLLITLLELTGAQFADYIASVSLDDMAQPVSWASDAPAPMWLQIARELTEYWMHHQHVCEAVGVASLKDRRFLHPVLCTFVYALPRTYASISAPPETTVELRVTGAAADHWYVILEAEGWALYKDTDITPASVVMLDGDTAWRIFTKGITLDEAAAQVSIDGDVALGRVLLNTVAIIA